MKLLNFCLLFFLFSNIALGQNKKNGSIDTAIINTEKNIIPIFLYSNETSFGAGAVYSYYFPAKSALKVSNIQSVAIYTLRNQIMFFVVPEYFTPDNRFKLSGLINVRKYPDVFYGIGNDVKEFDREKYTPHVFKFSSTVLRYLNRYWKTGLTFFMQYEDIKEKEAGGLLDIGNIEGSDHYWISGLGLVLSYDSRNNIFMSSDGGFAEVSFNVLNSLFGSNLDYQMLNLDLRRFVPLDIKRSLAFQLYLSKVWGEVPFQELPTLGGRDILRGFLQGKYRDKFIGVLQSEFRCGIYKSWGGIAFISTGNVYSSPKNFDIDRLKTAGGLGIRYRLNENNTQLRLDFGFNDEGGFGVYFTILEAF